MTREWAQPARAVAAYRKAAAVGQGDGRVARSRAWGESGGSRRCSRRLRRRVRLQMAHGRARLLDESRRFGHASRRGSKCFTEPWARDRGGRQHRSIRTLDARGGATLAAPTLRSTMSAAHRKSGAGHGVRSAHETVRACLRSGASARRARRSRKALHDSMVCSSFDTRIDAQLARQEAVRRCTGVVLNFVEVSPPGSSPQ
jgi:hypothetical protein